VEDGLEKEYCSRSLDDALEKEEAFLALGRNVDFHLVHLGPLVAHGQISYWV